MFRSRKGNRRKYPRIRTELQAVLEIPALSEPIQTRVRNLSASGMEVVLEQQAPVLSSIGILLSLPDQEQPQRLKGQVVRCIPLRSFWQRRQRQGERYSVGISFCDLDYPLRAELIRFLQECGR